jgi:signal transduction histidine kinase
MHLGIKAKQVAAVTSIVGLAVLGLSLLQVASLARLSLQASRDQAELLKQTIFERAQQVVPTALDSPYQALGDDPGLRSILKSSTFLYGLTYAAITDRDGYAIAHVFEEDIGTKLPPADDLNALLRRNGLGIYWALHFSGGRTLEMNEPLLLGGDTFGSIRIGVSPVLIRKEVDEAIKPALITAFIALVISMVVATGLAQLILRPILVIRSGLSRLGKGEFGVRLDMPQRDEFGELGSFFNTVSAQLSADRTVLAGEKANLESVVEHLEDSVAVFNPAGELLFANPAMRLILPAEALGRPIDDLLPETHPYRRLVERSLGSGQGSGPESWTTGDGSGGESEERGERLVMTYAIAGLDGALVGVMLVARDIAYLSRVQSTINYSRKLVALGRLSAGVAHEVRNPLNAMTIHLELLRQKLGAGRSAIVPAPAQAGQTEFGRLLGGVSREAAEETDEANRASTAAPEVLEHLRVISGEIRRLDEVLQGFLKFTRPEDLKLQAVGVRDLLEDVVRVVGPEAEAAHVQVQVDCPNSVPDINADPAMLRQALLNLAINACQAMQHGGLLRITAHKARDRRVGVTFEDNGVGISPEHLQKIFNLYFTTKAGGSGIGLSMVYRTVQLHDGEIEVQSTPGRGTTFRLLLPQL